MSCGALQRVEVKKTAQATLVGHVCNVDIHIISPQVHSLTTAILGSQETESVFRVRFPARRGQYTPPEVTALSFAPEMQADGTTTRRWRSSGWNYGMVNFTGDKIDIELFESPYNGSHSFPYNGTYSVEPADACITT
jgi:hypothetical protein